MDKKAEVQNLSEFIQNQDREQFIELTDSIHDFLLDLRNNPEKAIKELEDGGLPEDNLNAMVDTFDSYRNLRSVMISLLTKYISSTEI